MGKYDAFSRYLAQQAGSALPMTFDEIARVAGVTLPRSAFEHRPWWSNNPGNNVMTKAWLDAGWVTSDVDMTGRKLVFRRTPASATTDYPTVQRDVALKGLSEETMKWLGARARAADKTVAETAKALVEAHARPSVAERLEMLDRIRGQQAQVIDYDMVAAVRADRDSR
jgi:hypothetical protein